MSTTKFEITGRIGFHELKEIKESIKTTFTVAINRRSKGKEITHWLRSEMWCPKTERSKLDVIQKGNKVRISGYLKPDQYAKNGLTKSELVYCTTSVELLKQAKTSES